ncbi:MAG: hypothetical protein IT439_05830 [Phycisphaerales bacterium]|nr:hypothetical protein [Phycisphaerales bacterium]
MVPRRAFGLSPTRRLSLVCLSLAAGFATSPALLTAGAAITSLAAAPARADDVVPLTSITLYRSGVGYFQRTGMVSGDASIQLRFKTDQINDILKSMVLLDLGGGQIDAVSYSSKEPLEKRLAAFAVNIADGPDMPKLLSRLRGAPLAVVTPDGTISGTILSVEQQTVAEGQSSFGTHFVNLVTATGIRSVKVRDISSFDILDKQLAEELSRALAALAEHRTDLVKAVDLSFRGQGGRQVMVAYTHEMPVWKTSYRLILPEKDDGQPAIQGWAIVENTTDEDWNGVKLSLVAGQPIGFTMDLYQPLFVPRPEVPVPVMRGVGPVVYDGAERLLGLQDAAPAPASAPMAKAMRDAERRGAAPGRAGGQGIAEQAASEGAYEPSGDDMMNYAARSQARAGEIGEVFQYTLSNPVTIERQQSAMLPILTSNLEGRRVSIYNEGVLEKNPMRGVELTNSSDLQLLPGPISVFDGPAFAGDAQIGHVSVGEKRLLSYAVDLEVDVSSEEAWAYDVTAVRIVQGTVVQTVKNTQTKTYRISNKDKKRPRTVIVEHPRLDGWTLVNPKEPKEKTDSLYRFQVDVVADKAAELSVQQEQVSTQRAFVLDTDMNTLMGFQAKGKLSKAAIEAVNRAFELQRQVRQTEQRIAELEAEVRDITADQGRIRSNMGSVDRNSDLYRRYVTKLGEQETRLEQIARDTDAAQIELQARRDALNAYVSALSVE